MLQQQLTFITPRAYAQVIGFVRLSLSSSLSSSVIKSFEETFERVI